MAFRHDFLANCIGAVTILTEDRVVFQGQILRGRDEDRKSDHSESPQIDIDVEFILLELDCDVAIIRDNAQIQTTNPPLFEEGAIVRINVDNIVAVGPSNGCFDKGKDA